MSALSAENLRSIAEELRLAEEHAEPTDPVASRLARSPSAAYAVQLVNIDHRITTGQRVTGRKIGLTSKAVQAQLGVNEPDFGTLTSDMMIPDHGVIDLSELIAPRLEAEIAFAFATDLDQPDIVDDTRAILRAVHSLHPALEVVDSRIRDWRIELADTVADNGSAARYVLGPAHAPCTIDELADVEMTMRTEAGIVSRGAGRDCLDNPINAVQWLARRLLAAGTPIRQGNVILSGALGPMVTPRPGDHVEVNLDMLGTVHASIR